MFSRKTSICLLILGLVACGQATTGPWEAGQVQVKVVAGANQEGIVGQELLAPITVQVVNSETREKVVGHTVNFVVTEGDGTVFAGVAITDTLGRAADWWTLGKAPGEQKLEVRAVTSDGDRITYVVVTAMAVPDVPDSVVLVMDHVQAWIGVPILASEIVEQVFDQFGNELTVIPTWLVSPPFIADGDTLLAFQEMEGRVAIQVGDVLVFVDVVVRRNLRLYEWAVRLTCGGAVGKADSLVMYGTIDSITSGSSLSPSPYVLFSRLTEEWWVGDRLMGSGTIRILRLNVSEQGAGWLTYRGGVQIHQSSRVEPNETGIWDSAENAYVGGEGGCRGFGPNGPDNTPLRLTLLSF